MVSYASRLPVGFAGLISREDSKTVEPMINDGTNPPTYYGSPVKLNGSKARTLASGDANTVITGFLVRPYPTESVSNGLGAAVGPTQGGICDVLKRGYIFGTLKDGAAVKDGAVYVVTTAGGAWVIGDIVASASPTGGGTAVAVPNAKFMGPAAADGIVEIAFNI